MAPSSKREEEASGANDRFIIIDTDAGVDDAVGLMMALHALDTRPVNENLKLLGITCVSGNTSLENVITNVSITLDQYGKKDIPVYKGCWRSFTTENDYDNHFGLDGLGDEAKQFLPVERICETESAVSMMLRMVKRYPKRVSFICLAPLTNLAAAYLLEPEFFNLIEKLYIIGGDTDSNGDLVVNDEFNFTCDPVAADIVLSRATCPLILTERTIFSTHKISQEAYKLLTKVQTRRGKFFSRITKIRADFANDTGIKLSDMNLVCGILFPETLLRAEEKLVRLRIHETDSVSNLKKQKVLFYRKLDIKRIEELLLEVLKVDSLR